MKEAIDNVVNGVKHGLLAAIEMENEEANYYEAATNTAVCGIGDLYAVADYHRDRKAAFQRVYDQLEESLERVERADEIRRESKR